MKSRKRAPARTIEFAKTSAIRHVKGNFDDLKTKLLHKNESPARQIFENELMELFSGNSKPTSPSA
jgi:hypothetical protein